MYLTKQEKLIIYFLTVAIVLGAVVGIYRNYFCIDDELIRVVETESEKFATLAEGINDSAFSIKSTGSASQPKGVIEKLVNLNTASAEELTSLPKIGPVTAERIIRYREEFGNFSDVDELNNVKGIGEKTIEGLRHLVTL